MKPLLIAVLLSFTIQAGAQSIQSQRISETLMSASQAYERNDFAQAWALYKPLADSGNAEAQRFIGRMLVIGEGREKNFAEALQWFRRSADQGNAQAMRHLGIMYRNGEGVAVDEKTAVSWYMKSAQSGDKYAMTYIAARYCDGRELPQDDMKCKSWVEKALTAGDKSASRLLSNRALRIELDSIDRKFPTEAYQSSTLLFQRAAEAGDVLGRLSYAVILYNGNNHSFKIPANPIKAIDMAEIALDELKSDAELQSRFEQEFLVREAIVDSVQMVALAYFNGYGRPQNFSKVRALLRDHDKYPAYGWNDNNGFSKILGYIDGVEGTGKITWHQFHSMLVKGQIKIDTDAELNQYKAAAARIPCGQYSRSSVEFPLWSRGRVCESLTMADLEYCSLPGVAAWSDRTAYDLRHMKRDMSPDAIIEEARKSCAWSRDLPRSDGWVDKPNID